MNYTESLRLMEEAETEDRSPRAKDAARRFLRACKDMEAQALEFFQARNAYALEDAWEEYAHALAEREAYVEFLREDGKPGDSRAHALAFEEAKALKRIVELTPGDSRIEAFS